MLSSKSSQVPQHFSAETKLVADLMLANRQFLSASFGAASSQSAKTHIKDIVTNVDIEIEENLKLAIEEAFPGIPLFGEESGYEPDTPEFWLVDPVDGTYNYAIGIPQCVSMICHIKDRVVVASIIYDFLRDELYTAELGKGAFLNGKPIAVSNKDLRAAIVALRAYPDQDNFLDVHQYLYGGGEKAWPYALNCTGYIFALTASGKVDAYINTKPVGGDWDYGPGTLLVSEAGGIVTNIGKDSYTFGNQSYIAANTVIHRQITTDKASPFYLA